MGRGGRPPRLVDKHAVLAMVLTFYCDPCNQKRIVELCGIPRSTQSRTLKNAECALFEALHHLRDAQVRWPKHADQVEWANAVTRKESMLTFKFGFIDGKNYRVQKPGNSDLQNAYYNGWLHTTLITGPLCFGVDGTIIWGCHNNPGSWNDAETSREFLERLLEHQYCPDQRMGVLSDSAFPVSHQFYTRIETPLKEGYLDRVPIHLKYTAIQKSNAICAIRQAAEWGMGAAEKVFQRLRVPLPYNPTRRAVRLMNIHRLYNFRVRTTGISQIRTVFLS